MRVVASVENVAPGGPKRTAAQSRKGSSQAPGERAEIARAAPPTASVAKSMIAVVTTEAARRAASVRLRRGAAATESRQRPTKVRMAGAMVNPERTFEEKRTRNTCQKGSPRKVATAAASRNDER